MQVNFGLIVQAFLFLIGQGFGAFSHISFLASRWLEDCANFTLMPEETDQYFADYSWCNLLINAQLNLHRL
jgi:hypothetical protein